MNSISKGVIMNSFDNEIVIVRDVKQEPVDCSESGWEVTEVHLANPEIKEESLDKFSETSEDGSSLDHVSYVKQEPELSIISKLPPVAEHDEELRKRLTVNLRKFDTKWIQKTRLFETFFKCPKCQVVKKNCNAERHVMTCRGPISVKISDSIYHCYRCRESFNMIKHWNIHMRKHRRKIHQKECQDCGEKFKTRSLLENHRKIMGEHKSLLAKSHTWNQKTSTCNGCGTNFRSMEKFLKHRKLIKCIYCDSEFQCKYARMQHFRKAHRQNFKCPKCSYVGKNLRGLKIHSFSHIDETLERISNQYICDKCGQKFYHKASILGHQRKMGNYKCTICDQEFECMYAKNKHSRSVHGFDFKCQKCCYVGKNLIALRVHAYRFHKTVKEKFSCDNFGKEFICRFCRKIFSTKDKLSEHLRSYHKKFECDICGEGFFWKKDLRRHMINTHVNKRHPKNSTEHHSVTASEALKFHDYCRDTIWFQYSNYKCHQCKEMFDSRKLLNFHNLKHHPVSCSYCGKEFCNKFSLKQHQSNSNCKCFICDEKFKCRGGSDKHRLAHDNKLCLKCPFIGETITQLKMHCLRSHQIPAESQPMLSNREFQSDFDNAHSNENTEKLKKSGFSESTTIPEHEEELRKQLTVNLRVSDAMVENSAEKHAMTGPGPISPTIYRCDRCQESFNSREDWQDHIKQKSTSQLRCLIKCDYCGGKFYGNNGLKTHQNHMGNYKCIDCDTEFKCIYAKNKHLYCVEGQNIMYRKCPFVGKQEPELSIVSKLPPVAEHEEELRKQLTVNLRVSDAMVENSAGKHAMTGPGPISPTIYRCDLCQESFTSREDRQDHVRKHKPASKLQCEYRGGDFNDINDSKSQGSYKCTVCNKEFKCKYAKFKHIQDVHGQDFKCTRCPFVGRNLTAIENHKSRIDCICLMCDKEHECLGTLDKHYQSAHDDKLCPKCPFIGRSISALKLHFLRNHPILQKVKSHSISQHRIISPSNTTLSDLIKEKSRLRIQKL